MINSTATLSLNALSGIGGVQTYAAFGGQGSNEAPVLMPCRALEAFRRIPPPGQDRSLEDYVLMPCRALEAFRLKIHAIAYWVDRGGLNALSGIGGVQTQEMVRLASAR